MKFYLVVVIFLLFVSHGFSFEDETFNKMLNDCKYNIEKKARYDYQWTAEEEAIFSKWFESGHIVVLYGDNVKFQSGLGVWFNMKYECSVCIDDFSVLYVDVSRGRLHLRELEAPKDESSCESYVKDMRAKLACKRTLQKRIDNRLDVDHEWDVDFIDGLFEKEKVVNQYIMIYSGNKLSFLIDGQWYRFSYRCTWSHKNNSIISMEGGVEE